MATGRVETRLEALIEKIRLFEIFIVSTGADFDRLQEGTLDLRAMLSTHSP